MVWSSPPPKEGEKRKEVKIKNQTIYFTFLQYTADYFLQSCINMWTIFSSATSCQKIIYLDFSNNYKKNINS